MSQQSKDSRKQGHEERKAVSDKQTPQQRLAVLDERGFAAKKERARLQALIEKASKKSE